MIEPKELKEVPKDALEMGRKKTCKLSKIGVIYS
jgi:hypothetical protein